MAAFSPLHLTGHGAEGLVRSGHFPISTPLRWLARPALDAELLILCGSMCHSAACKRTIQVTPDSGAKPAIVTPDFFAPFSQKPGAPSAPSPPSASVCEEYRELIAQGLARGWYANWERGVKMRVESRCDAVV